MDERIDWWSNGIKGGCMEGRVDRWMNGCMEIWMDEWIYRLIDCWIAEWVLISNIFYNIINLKLYLNFITILYNIQLSNTIKRECNTIENETTHNNTIKRIKRIENSIRLNRNNKRKR